MKKLLFLVFLMCPFALFAKFYKGAITLNDGSLKSGFIEIPDRNDRNKIKFRATKDGDTEKLKIEEVKEFYVINDKNVTLQYLTLKLANIQLFSQEYKTSEDKSWVRIERAGKINIVQPL